MKKYIPLFLALTLTGLLTACAGGPAASSTPSAETSVSSPSESVSLSPSSAVPESSSVTSSESAPEVAAADEDASSAAKTLVVYYSRTGNTKAVAEQIAQLTDGDLFEIQTVAAYPADYEETTEVAKKEQNENARPELSTALENLADYDTVFIGYPIWWGDLPMAVYSFLDTYDLAGKTILPFCTHGGSGLSGTDTNIQAEEPNADVAVALALNGSGTTAAQQAVGDWLKNTGILAE